ncbi:MAG: lipoate--protein ligase family protein [Candidatus Poribacteria bacterium]|nr:lipoate--protein ligase family protein [Candidatus Poribacteria bacterium]
MVLLDMTLPSPEENLACDEVLLERCEAGEWDETLRFWEPPEPFVVVGLSNRVEREVNVAACRERGAAITRRRSGGGAVVQAVGCLNMALVLSMERDPALARVGETNRWIMARQRDALQPLVDGRITLEGDTDLALDWRKFSGNASRRKRRRVLFHGTFLLGMDIGLMDDLLATPSRAPKYREGRSHAEFVTNLPALKEDVKQALIEAWGARDAAPDPPMEAIGRLARDVYGSPEWTFRRR